MHAQGHQQRTADVAVLGHRDGTGYLLRFIRTQFGEFQERVAAALQGLRSHPSPPAGSRAPGDDQDGGRFTQQYSATAIALGLLRIASCFPLTPTLSPGEARGEGAY